MATGQQWREYFERKSKPYLDKQIKIINTLIGSLDSKIYDEFQLSYLTMVKHIMIEVAMKKKHASKGFGGVF